jgi:hypothetical protein
MAIQFVLGYQFHRALQKVCEFLRQGQALREQVVTSRKVDQEIHVAVDPLFAPRNGAEYSKAPSAILRFQRPANNAYPCHNFVTAPTKFGVIRRDRQRRYVIVISCVTV